MEFVLLLLVQLCHSLSIAQLTESRNSRSTLRATEQPHSQSTRVDQAGQGNGGLCFLLFQMPLSFGVLPPDVLRPFALCYPALLPVLPQSSLSSPSSLHLLLSSSCPHHPGRSLFGYGVHCGGHPNWLLAQMLSYVSVPLLCCHKTTVSIHGE
jgi:hypothetical protein